MALRNQPYIPLYVNDFMSDEKLTLCSAESTGVYIRMMCLMHKSDEYGVVLLQQKFKQDPKQTHNFACQIAKFLPYDVEVIERSIEELLLEGVITLDGDRLYQKRMVKDEKTSRVRAESGSKGGKKTQTSLSDRGSFALANNKANTQPNIEARLQANAENEIEYVSEYIRDDEDGNEEKNEKGLVKSTSNGAIAENPRKSDDRFDSFWKAYPRKEGKSEARKKFEAIMKSKDAPTIEKLIASIEDHKRSYGWQKDNGQFIPQPARYLNAGMYDDEITEGFGSSKPTGEPKNGVTRITPEFFDTLKKGDKK